jgi:hypothetical protein
MRSIIPSHPYNLDSGMIDDQKLVERKSVTGMLVSREAMHMYGGKWLGNLDASVGEYMRRRVKERGQGRAVGPGGTAEHFL